MKNVHFPTCPTCKHESVITRLIDDKTLKHRCTKKSCSFELTEIRGKCSCNVCYPALQRQRITERWSTAIDFLTFSRGRKPKYLAVHKDDLDIYGNSHFAGLPLVAFGQLKQFKKESAA